jgi:non-ribosomal peptide synthetase-like protein
MIEVQTRPGGSTSLSLAVGRPAPQLLHEFFEVQATARPDNVAVITPGRMLTYRQVDEAANRLARFLRAHGIGPGSLVGLLLPRGASVYIGLLGILKAGAGYVPLDPDYPPDRISYILSDCRAGALVTVSELADKADFPGKGVLLDRQADELAEMPSERLAPAETKASPGDLCYIIYTSGSTGKPKGVELEHRSVCNLVQVERQMFRVRPDDRVFQGFSIAFDASVEEVWLAFASGAALVVGTSEMVHAGPALSGMLTEARVTVFSTVPTLLSMLDEDIPTVRLLILGGEACPPDLVQRWSRPYRRMFNTYGPTEATVIATAWECVPGKPVTIGPPIPTYQVVLMGEDLKPVPPGQPGELLIAGPGVARGYVGRPDLTAERFVNLPLPGSAGPPVRMYRSGDLGRWTAGGEIEYLGRIDGQVKLRGFRVELSEIEMVLLECPGVQAAAVAVHKDAAGTQQLVGYLVMREGQEPDEAAIRPILRARLPHYMVPAILETLPSLPTMPSGKVDRRSLPPPRPRQPKVAAADPNRPGPRNDLEKQIYRVWEKVFAPQPVSIRDDFFLDLGGHSLLAARMVSELRKEPDLGEVAVLDVYRHPTVEALAAHVRQRRLAAAARDPAAPPPGSPAPSQFHPVSPGAHRLCAVAQLVALYFILGFASLQLLVPYLVHTWAVAAGYRAGLALLLAAASAVAAYPLMVLISLAVKWGVIGRFRAGFYPLWGMYYFRWWFVKSILAVVPRALLAGTPLLNLYFRLLGARIGKNVYLGTDEALAFDLLHIGDETHVGAETVLSGCVVEDGLLKIGHIDIGPRCFVGTRCVLRPGAAMAESSTLEDLSLLRSENRIRAGKRKAGSPAVPVAGPPLGRPRRDVPYSRARRVGFALLSALGVFVFPALLLAALFPGLVLLEVTANAFGGYWYLAFTPLVALSFIVLFCLEVALCKWLLLGRVRPGHYPLYGSFHFRKWIIDNLMDLVLNVLLPLHTSLYQVPWYRLLGARIGRGTELSTATNVTPDLVTVGDGSFVADSVSLGAARVEAGQLTVEEVRVGNKTFVGNSALLPPGAAIGDGCLIGVLSTTPADQDAGRAGLTWLGSPSFSLPQRQQSTEFPEEQTFRPTRKLRVQRALIEAVRAVLPLTVAIFLTCLLMRALLYVGTAASMWAVAAVLPLFLALCGVAAMAFAIGLKWAVMGRYRPRERPLWSPFVWGTELVAAATEWLGDVYLIRNLLGTPYVCAYFRLLGAKVGRRVYMDTAEMTEFDLIEIGDDTALNETCTIQTHLFEDRVMKMSYVRIGKRCSVGAGSTVLYDTYLADGSSLEDLSLLMKGEVLPAKTAWTGIPAIPATKSAEREVLSTMLRDQDAGRLATMLRGVGAASVG